MTERRIRTALISSDPKTREVVWDVLGHPGLGTTLDLEIAARFAEFGEDQVQGLRKLAPGLVIIDMEDDPDLGVRLMQFLAEVNPGQRFIAIGPTLSPEHLLSAMRAGVSDYLAKPVTFDALREAVQRVSQHLGLPASAKTGGARQPGEMLAVFSAKGGSGSTTVAANLAITLHRLSGKRTLLADLDLELGEVALQLGIQPRFSFVDMVQNFHRMDAGLLASYIEQHESGVHVLSAPFTPERSENASADDIRRILHFLRQHYDYVVVDTSKSFTPLTMAAFEQSDQVFLVTTADLPSLRNIQRGLPLLRRVMRHGDNQLRLVLNRYDPDDPITVDDVQRTLGISVYATLRNDYEAVIGSLNTGHPIVLNGTSKIAQDIKALGARLAGLPTETDRKGLAGILSRLKSGRGGKQG